MVLDIVPETVVHNGDLHIVVDIVRGLVDLGLRPHQLHIQVLVVRFALLVVLLVVSASLVVWLS